MKRIVSIIILAVLLFAGIASAANVELTVMWTANTEPDIAGYRLYCADIANGPYQLEVEFVGKVNGGKFQTVMNQGETIYCRLKAYDTEALESVGYSNEASYRLPNTGEDRQPPKVPGGLGLTGVLLKP